MNAILSADVLQLADRYARLVGLVPGARESSPEFRFGLGERRPRRPGSRQVYTVLGYAFDGRGAPRYVILDDEGQLGTRSAARANAVYGLALGLDPRVTGQPAGPAPERRVGPARRVGRMTLYPILGAGIDGLSILPLLDAIEQGLVVVHETGSVAELAVDVTSPQVVLGLAGDLLRGGRQDRTVRLPAVLAPGSRRAPLLTACVEAQRWSARQGESVTSFASSRRVAPASLRARLSRGASQSDVWEYVASTQECLGRSRGAPVRDERSHTSMVLSLEDPDVARTAAELARAAGEAVLVPEALGFAVALDGALQHAEWFGTPALFQACAPRLLESLAIDALSRPESLPGALPAELPVELVRGWVDAAASGPEDGAEPSVGCSWVRRSGLGGATVREVRDVGGRVLHVQVAAAV